MNQEIKDQLWTYVKLGAICIFAMLYSWAGCGHGLYLRRFIAPIALTCFYLVYNGNYRHLFILPFMCIALSLPYGASDLWVKIGLRFAFGLSCSLSFGAFLALKKRWLLLIYHTILVVSAFITFGVWNPFNSARIEETILAVLICLIPTLAIQRSE